MLKDEARLPALVEKDKCCDQPRAVHSRLAANENSVTHPPSLRSKASDFAETYEGTGSEFRVGKPVTNLLDAPRCRLGVGVERHNQIEGAFASTVAGLDRHAEVAGFAGAALPEAGEDLCGCGVGPARW